MRWRLWGAALPAAWVLTVAASPLATPTLPVPFPPTASTPTPTPQPTPTPAPTPTPYRGSVSISPTLGPPGTTVTLTGAGFPPGAPVNLYWDTAQRALGGTTVDQSGAFKTDVRTPDGDPGQHSICAQASGSPDACAAFKLNPAPSPTPSDTPTPTAVPSSSATSLVSPNPTPAPRDAGVSPVAALLQPPFVIFPILVALAAIGGAVYWIVTGNRRRPAPIAAARISHASVRPPAPSQDQPQDGPGTPIGGPAPPRPDPPPPPPPTRPAPRPLAGDDNLDMPQPGD